LGLLPCSCCCGQVPSVDDHRLAFRPINTG
jgi:hypothetical protein